MNTLKKPTPATVGDLRELIKDLPDSMPIALGANNGFQSMNKEVSGPDMVGAKHFGEATDENDTVHALCLVSDDYVQ